MKKSTKLNFSTLSADHRSKLCEQFPSCMVGGAGEPRGSYAALWLQSERQRAGNN